MRRIWMKGKDIDETLLVPYQQWHEKRSRLRQIFRDTKLHMQKKEGEGRDSGNKSNLGKRREGECL